MKDLLPVLLGSDANVYGMARSFYMEYGVTSLAIGKGALAATANSKLVKMAVVEPNLEDDGVFVRTLTDFAKAHPGKTLVLVSCGDNYTGLMARARAALEPYYKFACPTPELVVELDTKEFFYKACERHGLAYPRTFGCTSENYKAVELPFPFPCIIKASNSVAYWNCKFPHKKKVFVAYSKEEFDAITAAIYSSSYQDNLVLQEYIPGDDNCMRVLNCYSGLDHKVKLMALGRPLLEEQTPEGIGNYAAIVNVRDDELMEKMKAFLEDVGWEGFSNFDMKYDARDGKYKLFEMNPRQGRSSFFVTAGGGRGGAQGAGADHCRRPPSVDDRSGGHSEEVPEGRGAAGRGQGTHAPGQGEPPAVLQRGRGAQAPYLVHQKPAEQLPQVQTLFRQQGPGGLRPPGKRRSQCVELPAL